MNEIVPEFNDSLIVDSSYIIRDYLEYHTLCWDTLIFLNLMKKIKMMVI